MAATADLSTVFENCRISPPPNTVGERSLPLTFFDMGWLLQHPIHQLFFYEFAHSKDHFIQTVVPNLKHSLSIALQHFFPFAGNLVVFRAPDRLSLARKPEIRYAEGDSVAVTFAECTLEFNDLIGNHPRECNKFHPLIPRLGGSTEVSDLVKIPVFSVQVTLFPNSGIAIGLTNLHTLSDASTRFDFLRAWTSIARHGTDELFLANGSLPFYDRVINIPNFLDEICLNQPGIQILFSKNLPYELVTQADRVRATFVLTRPHINQLKKWLSIHLPTLEYASSFSVGCAFVWSCIAKSRAQLEGNKGEDELERFTCVADWRARLEPPVPQTYFGNCVGPCFATTKTTSLLGNTGFLNAAESLGNAINQTVKNKKGVLKDAETWLERAFIPVPTIGVAGTPKVQVYELDFGWGKPKKYETISIDYNSSISVNTTKESSEDIEIGLSLPAKQMDAFITISRKELENIFSK